MIGRFLIKRDDSVEKCLVNRLKEKGMELVFLAAACISILCVALICIFLFANGLPAMREIGVTQFLLGKVWKPGADIYGIFPMIVGSVYVTGLALVIGVPIALLTAIYLAYFCPAKMYRFVKPAIELMAGIPSVVYGFFGIAVLVPMVRVIGEPWNARGNSILTASVLLAMMILPTIIGVVEPALKAVPRSYYEGALALGATHERSVFAAVLPAAKSGILAGIVLGLGRAMGVIFTPLISSRGRSGILMLISVPRPSSCGSSLCTAFTAISAATSRFLG